MKGQVRKVGLLRGHTEKVSGTGHAFMVAVGRSVTEAHLALEALVSLICAVDVGRLALEARSGQVEERGRVSLDAVM
jgi:hypothetical protein